MWLSTKLGAYSIVQKRDGIYTIRARVRSHLENLIGLAELEDDSALVHTGEHAEYRFSIEVDIESLLEVFVQLAAALDYSNFKHCLPDADADSSNLCAHRRYWELLGELEAQESATIGHLD